MNMRFEELAWQQTAMGEVSLRRRLDPMLGVEVYEVKLGDEFLMSSLFTVAEVELARLGLAELSGGDLEVVVGGLGLGFTAMAVLADDRVRSLAVVDALDAVIGWHRQGLLPFASPVVADQRCRLVHGDFFALDFEPVDAILADIDHSPRHLLNPQHAAFYTADGLTRLATRLHPGGVFGLWSNDPPDEEFVELLGGAFEQARAEVVSFDNPLQERMSANTVYLATTPADGRRLSRASPIRLTRHTDRKSH
jgi:spermidine synthase